MIFQKQTHRRRSDLWLPAAEDGRRGNWMKAVKRYKLPVISTRVITYNMINVVNTTVRYMWKLLRG